MRLKRNLNRYSRVLNFDREEGYKIGTKTKHCCQLMAKFVDDPRVEIYYYPEIRAYYLITSSGAFQLIYNCPFCGCDQPKELKEEWAKAIKKECKIDPYDREQESKVPKEFKSDEWWKKRGL